MVWVFGNVENANPSRSHTLILSFIHSFPHSFLASCLSFENLSFFFTPPPSSTHVLTPPPPTLPLSFFLLLISITTPTPLNSSLFPSFSLALPYSSLCFLIPSLGMSSFTIAFSVTPLWISCLLFSSLPFLLLGIWVWIFGPSVFI